MLHHTNAHSVHFSRLLTVVNEELFIYFLADTGSLNEVLQSYRSMIATIPLATKHQPDFFSGEGGVVPNLLGELETLLRLQEPGLAVVPGGVPMLNCTGGEISAKLILGSEPWRCRFDSRLSEFCYSENNDWFYNISILLHTLTITVSPNWVSLRHPGTYGSAT